MNRPVNLNLNLLFYLKLGYPYFENLKCIDVSIDNKLPYLSDSTSVFDQDVFTDMPDF